MKLLLIAVTLPLMCCTTVTAPDGTVTKKFDNEAFGSIVGGVVTIGGVFGPRKQLEPVEVTYSK